MSQVEDLLRDLVVANRILANEDVVDAYGHISVRHPDNPKRFFMARSLAVPASPSTVNSVTPSITGKNEMAPAEPSAHATGSTPSCIGWASVNWRDTAYR